MENNVLSVTKMNHIVEEFYSKHGYPPWIKQNGKHASNSISLNSDTNSNAHQDQEYIQIMEGKTILQALLPLNKSSS